MRSVLIGMGLIACIGLAPGLDAAAKDWAVGETWVYQHQGFRPFAPPDQTQDTTRTRKILSIQGEGAEKRWLLEEKWGAGEGPAAVWFINADKCSEKIEAGENFVMNFKPCLPVDWSSLETGKEWNVNSETSINGNTSKFQYAAKRLEDETVTVPAGEFKNAARVQVAVTISFTTDQGERSFKMNETYWYHPDVNGFVKETIEFVPPAGGEGPRDPLKGTSVLQSHTLEKKE